MESKKDKQIIGRVTSATQEALERIAKEMDRSVSWIINDLVLKFIAEHGSKKRGKR
jgi:predicted transcriptional regulator